MIYNTRIAPSPTGDMHIGTARTAYFNWLAAKASGGKFYLRIDDTDKARNIPGCVDVIKDTLTWLGLNWDELVFQSQRTYPTDKIPTYESEGAIRLSLKEKDWFGLPKSWTDEVVGEVKITDNDLKDMEDMVLIKSDGSPTYNWASIVDDMLMKVNYIIRGTDHITNTSKQVILWSMLGAEIPKFAHVGLIGEKGKPLSKRDGAASMLFYQDKGYDADAMLNFLARMGWSPTVDDKTTKMLSREKMLQMFLTQGKMKSNLANIDMDKLEAFDRKYKAAKKIWRNGDKLL
jgi:glutamyl-tRNA synthetase